MSVFVFICLCPCVFLFSLSLSSIRVCLRRFCVIWFWRNERIWRKKNWSWFKSWHEQLLFYLFCICSVKYWSDNLSLFYIKILLSKYITILSTGSLMIKEKRHGKSVPNSCTHNYSQWYMYKPVLISIPPSSCQGKCNSLLAERVLRSKSEFRKMFIF